MAKNLDNSGGNGPTVPTSGTDAEFPAGYLRPTGRGGEVAPTLPRRIHIVGSTGSGKSTLGQQLAATCGVPHVELDALYWQADWQGAPLELFAARVSDALAGDGWVVDGNYSSVRGLVHARAELVIWLDYPLAVNYWRLFKRSLRRWWTAENLWGSGNRESFRKQFASRDSLFVYLTKTRAHRQREYGQLFRDSTARPFAMVRLRSPRATSRWLDDFRAVCRTQSLHVPDFPADLTPLNQVDSRD